MEKAAGTWAARRESSRRAMHALISQKRSGMTLTEVMIAAAVTAILAAGMLTGISTLRRSFQAAQHHAKSQVEQGRLLGYIARDLRRATSVKIEEAGGAQRLTVTMPDFYDGANKPRDPRIKDDEIEYADAVTDAADPVRVSFYKEGATIFRSVKRTSRETGLAVEQESVTALATDVGDFLPNFTDDGKQSIGVSISFIPRFQLNPENVSDLRSGTAVYATTLLRNKRY
jgi:prepilin-type N-terminal cleavage/methylation domain-containing protein